MHSRGNADFGIPLLDLISTDRHIRQTDSCGSHGGSHFMYLYKENNQYFVQNSKDDRYGRQIISETIYYEYMRPEWKEAKRQSREKICRDGKGKRCHGDCSTCPHKPNGKPLSLESFEEVGLLPASSFSIEEYVIHKELHQALNSALNSLEDQEKDIIWLYFYEGNTEAVISKILGCSQKTVNNRKRSIIEKLQELLKDYR